MTMRLQTLFLLACAIVIAGCASDQALRKSSGELALRVNRVSEDAEKFVAARTRVMKARTATLTALEANALDSEQSNQAEISYHAAAGDTVWVELIERLRKAPDLVVQQRKDQETATAAAQAAVQNAKSAADFKTAKLTEASNALAALAEEPDDKDVIAFYKDFFKEVQKSFKDKADQADKAADSAERASKEKGAAASSSAEKDQADKTEKTASAVKASK
jgi:hypothetical protein